MTKTHICGFLLFPCENSSLFGTQDTHRWYLRFSNLFWGLEIVKDHILL